MAVQLNFHAVGTILPETAGCRRLSCEDLVLPVGVCQMESEIFQHLARSPRVLLPHEQIDVRHRTLAIAALAPFGIHPGHKLLLLELEAAGPRTQAQLAAASGYEPPTITLSVRQLEALGLVVRRSSPSDGRATIVELSDQGRAFLPKLRAAWRRVAEQTVSGLDSIRIDEIAER